MPSTGERLRRSCPDPTATALTDSNRDRYCLNEVLEGLPDAGALPWAPGHREEFAEVERRAAQVTDIWCLTEVDIFTDLSAQEMDAIAAAAPVRDYAAGELLYSPTQPREELFILKRGRVRTFRVSAEGRAVTTAIVTPGTIFGEMLLLGQHMHDNYAEALEGVTVCVMSRDDVRRFLLSDSRIALRIAERLGERVSQLERRLSDTVLKSVPERVAATLCLLAEEHKTRPLERRGIQVKLTHEQIAALAGTSRETATKVLGEYADRGLLRLGRGRVTIVDLDGMTAEAGD
ncbi:MAG: Crp/Fnr family transcriptional regulator [Actinomycetota bacterium]|nr:Crp/Fnr family transcriptional regulator [Actinomycetota bacterium]